MKLPEQLTGDELQAVLEEKIGELKDNQLSAPGVTVEDVRAGTVEERARGAVIVRPSTERAVDLPAFASAVGITYAGLPEGAMRSQTGSARLIRVGETWRHSGLTGPWTGEHVFRSPGGRVELFYHCPAGTATPVLPPEPVSAGYTETREMYVMPPAATAVRGQGTIHYKSGHTVDVEHEQLLLRPLADGTLGSRPGGVYAEFESTEPPKVKLGTTWIEITSTVNE